MKSFDPMLRLAAAFSRAGLNRPWPRMNARVLSLGLGAVLLSGLGGLLLAKAWHQPIESRRSSTSAPSALVSGNGPCAPALVSHQGNDKVDLEIQRLQAAARSAPKRSDLMTQLGATQGKTFYRSSSEKMMGYYNNILLTERSKSRVGVDCGDGALGRIGFDPSTSCE
jgi:hypothetical protein